MAIGCLVPMVAAVITMSIPYFLGIRMPNFTPTGAALQEIFIGYAIWRYDLFALNPATAAENIISTLTDMLFLISPRGRIVTVNQAVVKALGFKENELLQSKINTVIISAQLEQILEGTWGQTEAHPIEQPSSPGAVGHFEGTLNSKNGRSIPAGVSISRLTEKDGTLAGHVIIARDMTIWKQAENERNRLIANLREALDNIKTLSGLIPICSVCIKVRNDQGYWQQVEEYVQEHSEVDFSHGICEACAQKLYPEFVTPKTVSGKKKE